MKTVNIIVEGAKDVYFIHELVLRRFPAFKREENLIPPNRLKNNAIDMHSYDGELFVHLKSINGFTEIKNLSNLMRKNPDMEGDFAWGIIFDADYPKPETRGGFKGRLDYLLELLKTPVGLKSEVSKSIFLFPNNKDNGDLEVLLEQMVAPSSEHYKFLSICWTNFADCVRLHGFNQVTQKSKMNEYAAAFYDGTWEDNGINRGLSADNLWDWDNHALDVLYGFLKGLFSSIGKP